MHGGIVTALRFVLFALAVRGANVASFIFCHSLNLCNRFESDGFLYDHLPENKLPIVGVKVISQAVQGIGTFINLRPAALIYTPVR